MRSTRSRRCLLASLVALAAVAAACGDDGRQVTTTAEAARDEVAPTAPATTTTTGAPEAFEGQLAGLTVIDANSFTVELIEADAEFPLRLAAPPFFALPDSAFEDPAAQNEMPIGNGPFMMADPWEHGVRISAVRNPFYRGPDPAKVDSYEWVFGKSEATVYNDVVAGELDVSWVPVDFRVLALRDFGDNLVDANGQGTVYVGIPSYLGDYTKEHRRALSMAIDREALVETLTADTALAAHAVVPPALGGRDHVCENWDYNPDKARELWDAAGGLDAITSQLATPFEFLSGPVVDAWSKTLGIDTSTVTIEWYEWTDYVPFAYTAGFTGPYFLGWGQDYPSPLNFLEPLFASYGGENLLAYDNPDFDAALAAGKAKVAATGQGGDGVADYRAAEDLLCDDAQAIPIYFSTELHMHSDNVSEVYVDSYHHVGYTVIEAEDGAVIANPTSGEPQSLFSTDARLGGGGAVLRALNTGLVQFDPRDNRPFNAHAESITSQDGGKTWTIVLNPGWTFHDATPNDAASYVKAWSYGADPANAQRQSSFFANIVGWDELNPDAGDD